MNILSNTFRRIRRLPPKPSKEDRRSFNLAASEGDLDAINAYLDKYPPECVDLQDLGGTTALMYAAMTGKGDAVNLLIRRGANIDLKDHDGLDAEATAKKHFNEGVVPLFVAAREERARRAEDAAKALAVEIDTAHILKNKINISGPLNLINRSPK